MPDVKVYIREKNIDKWKTIPNKADWINSLLEETPPATAQTKIQTNKYNLYEPDLSLLRAAGLEYRGEPGWAWDEDLQKDVPYTVYNGKLIRN